MFQQKTIICALFLSCLLLWGCSGEADGLENEIAKAIEGTLTAQVTPADVFAKPITPNLQPTQTVHLSPTSIPTLSPTPKPTLTPLPTATPIIYTYKPLNQHNPSVTDLEAYLKTLPEEYFLLHTNELDSLREFGLTTSATIRYMDLNGDDESDLVLEDDKFVSIFLRKNHQFLAPLSLIGSQFKYAPSSNVKFEDWTNDGNLEVVFEYRGHGGGTGYRSQYWQTYIVTCGPNSCYLIADPIKTILSHDYNSGGMTLKQADFNLRIDQNGELFLDQTWHGFSIFDTDFYDPFWSDDDYYIPKTSLKILTPTLQSYIWNGLTFEKYDQKDLGKAQTINSLSELASSNKGSTAQLMYENNGWLTGNNDICRLQINSDVVGEPFGCKKEFATVKWEDVIGNNEKEIIVWALSGQNPKDQDDQKLAEIDCVHTRQIIYQWDGVSAKEIANIAGCVIQSDLYGVALFDYDGDGQLDIIAANRWFSEPICLPHYICWFEFEPAHSIYRWNGEKFEFWQEVSQEDPILLNLFKTNQNTSPIEPNPQVILRFGAAGGHGAHPLYDFLGGNIPDFTLYEDGKLIQKVGSWGFYDDNEGFQLLESHMSQNEICSLLTDLKNTGYLAYTDNRQAYAYWEEDPIYQLDDSVEHSEGADSYIIQTAIPIPNTIGIYIPYLQYVIPEVSNALEVLSRFEPSAGSTSPFEPQEVVLWIEEIEDPDTITSEVTNWQDPNNSLKKLYNSINQEHFNYDGVLIDGTPELMQLFNYRLKKQYFKENGRLFAVTPRPLLPHQNKNAVHGNSYSDLPQANLSFCES